MPIPQLSQKVYSPHYWKKQPKKRPLFVYQRLSIPRQKKRKLKILSFFIYSILFFVFLGSLSFMIILAWLSQDLPNPDKLLSRAVAQSTKIYDRTGKELLYEIYSEEKRTLVELDTIPQHFKWATIVAEDKNFYRHPGFSFLRIIRALIANFVHRRIVQGASTITQQLVKNVILTPEKTFQRKVRELILSFQIERKFSKDEILKMYLNEIPYGSNAYGVEAASQIYFNKSVKDLTLDEAALIAALPKAPTYLSPYGSHKEELIGRQQYILNLMAKEGYLEREEAEKAKRENVLAKIKPRKEKIKAPHFVMYVKEILTERYGQRMVEQGGLKVITTLDLEKQKIAEEAITWGVERNKKLGASNAALVVLDTKTNQILAMVGSRDFFDKTYDGQVNVCLRPRQPGSSFKPIVYSAAFAKGYTPETILFDAITNFGPAGPQNKDYVPRNYDNQERGPISLRKALAGSLNIPAVKLLYLVGINNVLDLAEKMIYTTLKDRSRYGLALVLGGGEVTLLEHTAAYGIFSQEGIKYNLTSILRIEDSTDKMIEEAKEQIGERVLDKQVTRQITDILSDNEARAFIFGYRNYLNLGERSVAVKTGTTDDFRDAWTLGYTPSLAVGVWVGNNDNSPMKRGASGSVVAAPIWHKFLKEILAETKIESFNPPDLVKTEKFILNGQYKKEIKVKIDKTSKKLATDFTPESQIEEKTYQEVHNILHYVDKDNPQGPFPSDPKIDPQYERWEKAVSEWLKKQNLFFEKPPQEYDDLHIPENKPFLTILSPSNEAIVTESPLNISIETAAPRGVRRLEILVNDRLLINQFLNLSPSQFSTIDYQLSIDDLPGGTHILKIKVYDDIDNMNQAEVNIIIAKNP